MLTRVNSEPTSILNVSVTTSATGANYTAFGSQGCYTLEVFNFSGVALEFRRGATGTVIQVPHGYSKVFKAITNASNIDCRRVDLQNTPVTIYAEAWVS